MHKVLWVFFLISNSALASLTVGQQTALRQSDERFQTHLWYLNPAFKREGEAFGFSWTAAIDARVSTNLQPFPGQTQPWKISGADPQSELSFRDLYLALAKGSSRTVIGFQQISWGETFGFQILDIVNGRDLRDPLILETGWTRRSAPIVQQQFFVDSVTYQFIFTALPSLNRLPRAQGAFDVVTGVGGAELQEKILTTGDELPTMPEFGGKISHLFKNGLDMSVILYNHYNRNTIYQIRSPLQGFSLYRAQPVVRRVLSAGGSMSYALDEFVFRGDYIAHNGQPLATSTTTLVDDGTQHRVVVGTDWSRGDWTLGAQLQMDNNDSYGNAPWVQAQWGSVQISRWFLNRNLELSVFSFAGINNQDLWVEPKVQYIMGAVNISLRYDHIAATNTGNSTLYAIRDQDRTLLWLEAKF